MSEELDPNLIINSDLSPSFTEAFSKENEDKPGASLCCDGCTCSNPHLSVPTQY